MANKVIQLKDKDSNNLYPLILGDSIPDNGIDTSKLSKSVHDKINETVTNALSNYKSVEVVNDLTTGGTDKALSAEMGKKLSNDINNIKPQAAVINKPDNEDLEQTKDSDGNDVLRFKDNEYTPASFSGLGRKYLRKNVIDINAITFLEDATSSATVNTAKYVNLSAGVDGTAVIVNNNHTRYLSISCKAGDSFVIRGFFNKSIGTYFWGFVDSSNKILNCGNIGDDNRKYITAKVTADVDCTLFINVYYDYYNKEYSVQKITKDSTVSKVNILSNTEISEENTIYIIRNDYDLNQEVIELPKNSTLFFVGGSFKNGTLKGNFSSICTRSNTNILNDVHIEGTWTTTDWYAEWFNAAGDGVTDDTDALHRLLEISMSVTNVRIRCILSRNYFVTSGLLMYPNSLIDGANSGVITAKFSNPLDWVIQNYTPRTSDGKQPSYNEWIDWKAFDGSQYRQWNLNDQTEIKNIRIEGQLTDDNKPIFGGIKIACGYINTDNVYIINVGTGLFRSCGIKTVDMNDTINGIFYGYAARSVNGISFRDSYCNAATNSNIVYSSEYRIADADCNNKGIEEYTDDNGNLVGPRIATAFVAWCYKVLMENIVTDIAGCAVATLNGGCQITDINHWLEGAVNSYYDVYGTNLTIISPIFMSNPEYDALIQFGNVWLIGISDSFGSGNVLGTDNHKLFLSNYCRLYLIGCDKDKIFPIDNKITWIGNTEDNYITLLSKDSKQANSDLWHRNLANLFNKSSFGTPIKAIIPANTTVNIATKWRSIYDDVYIKGNDRLTSICDLTNLRETYLRNCITFNFSNLTIQNFNVSSSNIGIANFSFSSCNIKNININNQSDTFRKYVFESCKIYGNPNTNSDDNTSPFNYIQGRAEIEILNSVISPNIRLAKSTNGGEVEILNFRHIGNTSYANSLAWHLGYMYKYYNTDNKRFEYWNGKYWTDANGNAFYTTSGATENYPTNIGIKVGSVFHDTTLDKDVFLTKQGQCSEFIIKFNEKVTDGKLMSNSDVAIKSGKIHISFSAIELDVSLTNQDIDFILYNTDKVNMTLANWLAKKWMEAGYYAFTKANDVYLTDMKCGSAEIGTCADVSGSETNLSFTLAVQKGTANVWE